jgi:hypothetical protein
MLMRDLAVLNAGDDDDGDFNLLSRWGHLRE